MAEAAQLSTTDREAIAALLVPWVRHRIHLFALTTARPKLAEGYEVWVLDEARMADPVRVRDKAAFGDEWHHQIRAAESTPMSTRVARTANDGSAGLPGQGWRVNTVFDGRLVASIQTASDWIDANVPTDDRVRLLLAPSWMRTLFWLEASETDRIVPVDAIDLRDGIHAAQDATQYLASLQASPALAPALVPGGSAMPVEAIPPILPAPDLPEH